MLCLGTFIKLLLRCAAPLALKQLSQLSLLENYGFLTYLNFYNNNHSKPIQHFAAKYEDPESSLSNFIFFTKETPIHKLSQQLTSV